MNLNFSPLHGGTLVELRVKAIIFETDLQTLYSLTKQCTIITRVNQFRCGTDYIQSGRELVCTCRVATNGNS
jgi:hypothetical protein